MKIIKKDQRETNSVHTDDLDVGTVFTGDLLTLNECNEDNVYIIISGDDVFNLTHNYAASFRGIIKNYCELDATLTVKEIQKCGESN